jgi:hypothetical protein
VVAVYVTLGASIVVGAVVSIATVVPLAGIARLAARSVRGVDVSLGQWSEPIRQRPRAVLIAGTAFALLTLVFVLNGVAGLAMGDALGFAITTAAVWGILASLSYGFVFWPLLADPERDTAPSGALARFAGLVVLAYSFRIAALSLVFGALLIVSTVAFAALITITVAYVMLVSTRYVLPAADRLEAGLIASGRMTPLRIETLVDRD